MRQETRKRIQSIIETHSAMIAEFEAEGVETIAAAGEVITRSLRENGRVYICGNGGSAADAQHIASEFVGRFQCEREALPAVALTTDTSTITSVSNDYGYENVFLRQVQALVRKGDILWAISTSGASANVIAAAEAARQRGATVLAFTGKAGSRLGRLADVCLCVDSNSTARTQEIHQLAYHIICELVERDFARGPSKGG